MWIDKDFLQKRGIYSICSSNENVLDAAIEFANEKNDFLLVEATCHQVNQFGGYTHMTPEAFREKILEKIYRAKFPIEKVLLGGDHLGPDPWKSQKKEIAMKNAKELVKEFVKNGFSKIHLDCSMPLNGDNDFSPMIIAEREAELCKVAEETYSKYEDRLKPPVYVVGTEVPVAGGNIEEMPEVTTIEELDKTIEMLKGSFQKFGLENAWKRVTAIVVRLGIGFGDEIHSYESDKTKELCTHLRKNYPSLYFEAHSTDYQTLTSLKEMVRDGIRILKVGPALTYAYRKVLFSLNLIEREISGKQKHDLLETIIKVMNEHPQYWEKYYKKGDELRLFQMYSYFDRIRYYWNFEEVEKATDGLLNNLKNIPLPLFYQYLPQQYEEIMEGNLENDPRALIKYEIKKVLNSYYESSMSMVKAENLSCS